MNKKPNQATHKIHVYATRGPLYGEIIRKEYFWSKEAARDRYRELFRRELYGLNPTLWERDKNGTWTRVHGY